MLLNKLCAFLNCCWSRVDLKSCVGSGVQQNESALCVHISPALESIPMWAITEYRAEFPTLHGRSLLLFILCIMRRPWQPTPGILPGESHGQRSLADCIPWGHRESNTTERLSTFHISYCVRVNPVSKFIPPLFPSGNHVLLPKSDH